MSDDVDARFNMLHRDVDALRSRDNQHDELFAEQRETTQRMAAVLEEQGKTLAVISDAFPRVLGDMDHLKSQNAALVTQTMEHGKMLLEHAKLHTQHAESLAATREQARQAMQSSSDLSAHVQNTFSAIDAHVKTVAEATSEKLDTLVIANVDAAADRTLQTQLLQKIAGHAQSPKLAAAVFGGAFIGGLIAALFHARK